MSKNRPLLFIHGWVMNSRVWERQLRAFSPTHTVIAPDLRGHGSSSGMPGPYTIRQFADDLAELIQTLSEPPVIVAWSMGAMVALDYLLNSPGTVSGIVLVGSTPRFLSSPGFPAGRRPAMVKRLQENLERDYENYIREFCGRFFYSREKISAEEEKEIAGLMFAGGFPPPYNVAAETLKELTSWDISARLKEIKTPALIVHGSIDNIIAVDAGKEMNRLIPGSWLSIYEKRGHAPFLTASERFNRELEDFLERTV